MPVHIALSRRVIADYILIVAGMALYAVGFTAFILPHGIVTGGMAGFSSLFYYATGGAIPVGATMLVANFLLLAFGYRILGRTFVVRTVFGAVALSAMIGGLEAIFAANPPIIEGTALSTALGATVCGLGIALYFAHGGTTGGTDTVAAILEKISRIRLGQTMVMLDFAIVGASLALPFDGSWDERVAARLPGILYGLGSILIYSFIADRIVASVRRAHKSNALSD